MKRFTVYRIVDGGGREFLGHVWTESEVLAERRARQMWPSERIVVVNG